MTADPTTTLHHVIGADGLVAISLREGDLRLRAVEGDTVTVRALDHSPLEGLSVERGERSLAIRSGAGQGSDPRRGPTPDLVVELPAGASVVVESTSSDIVVEGLTGDQRYRSASGDLSMRGIQGSLVIEAMSGDIRIMAAGPGRYDLRSVSGDLTLEAGAIASLQATTTSGDLDVTGRFDGAGPFKIETVSGDLELAPTGDVRVEVRTISGDLGSDLPGRIEEGAGSRSFIVGAGGPTIDVRTTSGDVHLARGSRRADPAPARTPAAIAPPMPPNPPAAPPPPTAQATPMSDDPAELDVLRALERGDIDLDEARRRLAELDGSADPDTGDEVTDRG
jgi:Toastrack DUF4097